MWEATRHALQLLGLTRTQVRLLTTIVCVSPQARFAFVGAMPSVQATMNCLLSCMTTKRCSY